MTYSLSNNCTTNYYNRTLTVQVIVEDVVTWIFLRHSVYSIFMMFHFAYKYNQFYVHFKVLLCGKMFYIINVK